MKALLISTLGATLLLAPGTVLAQAKKGEKVVCTDKKAAKRDFVKGRLAYRRGDYEDAILKWQDSYAACEKALTLYNIGNAYERLGDVKAALTHFEKYRPLAEKHEVADLDSRMEGLRNRIAEEEKLVADQAAKDEQARKAEDERKRREAADQQTETAEGGDSIIPIVAWSALGVGGAAVIAGVIMDVVATSKRPDETQACTDLSGRLLCRETQRSDIESSNTLALAGDITWIAGAAIAAGGATVLILSAAGVLSVDVDGDSGDAKKTNDVIEDARIAPYGMGLQLHGSF